MSDMTIQNAIHCMKAIICEEVCEECDYYGKTGTDHCEADAVRMAIKALEEYPERKNGKWIFKKSMMYCSECCDGFEVGNYHYFKFCPNCGCRMKGDDDET